MLEGIYSDEGWTVSHESDLKVLYKHVKGRPCSLAIRLIICVQHPPIAVSAALIGCGFKKKRESE